MVKALSWADIPVEVSAASTDTVNAVLWVSVFDLPNMQLSYRNANSDSP